MNFIKRIFGIDKLEAQTVAAMEAAERATQIAKDATDAAGRATEAERQAKSTPKERATAKGEPWISVLDTFRPSQ